VGAPSVGASVEAIVGDMVGCFVGDVVGSFVGGLVGSFVGGLVGDFVGVFVGAFVGDIVGASIVGDFVGASIVGDFVGDFVGESPPSHVLHETLQNRLPSGNLSHLEVALRKKLHVLSVSFPSTGKEVALS